MKKITIVTMVVAVITLTGCSSKTIEKTSPCACNNITIQKIG